MVHQFVNSQPQQVAVHCSHPFEPPILGLLAEVLVQNFDFRDRTFEQLLRELLDVRVRLERAEKRLDDVLRTVLALLPLKEHLQGQFAGFSS